MAEIPPEGEGENLASLIGGVEIAFEAPVRRAFAPWHRPRKQYVRHRQWLGELEKMADEIRLEGTDFNYLSLPGDDLLDVRYLRDTLCEPRRLNMRFLGFNSAAAPESAESSGMQSNLHALKLLDWVDQISNVIPDDIRAVGNVQSVARQRIYEFGGFHAINLDLCDGFARHPIDPQVANFFDALRVLIEVQGRTDHDSLLMLTTRIGDGHVAADVAQRLRERLLENIANCEAFDHQVREQWKMTRMTARKRRWLA